MNRYKAPLWNHEEVENRILYEHQGLIAFNKPYDWPTSGRNLNDEDCVQFHLLAHLRAKGKVSPTPKYPEGMVWAVHQLDADTSGLLLFTTQKKLTHHYHTLLRADETEKTYLAIVNGKPSWDHHIEQSSVGKDSEGNYGVLSLTEGGLSARSDFTVLERHADYSILRIRIYTGRTHQIRIHLQHLGHPLLGEEWYTSIPCLGHPRQALHAYSISIDGLPEAPIPDDLKPFFINGIRK